MTSDELGFDTVHKPGALTRYFAGRWLEEPSAEGEQLIAWLLESALGRNTLYFIEKTKEYVDQWGGSGTVVPVDAFDGFVITGDPVEDTLIPHAVFVWTCMNGEPWPEEVYHDWLDKLLAAGSAEAAYLAASLWPAHNLMAKVTYRPVGWRVYQGQLDAEAERLILTEMLRGEDGLMPSLYGPFEYDDVPNPEQLPEEYIKRHGFTHPICGLVEPRTFIWLLIRYGNVWIHGDKMFLYSNHIGLYLYYDILQKRVPEDLMDEINSRRTRWYLYDPLILDKLFKRPGKVVDFELYIYKKRT